MTRYTKNLSEPWFTLVQLGIKTVEGRLNKGDFINMNIGDIILFINNDFGFERKFEIIIKDIRYYNNFKEYLETETLEKCLPGINSIDNGLSIYYMYYTPDDEILNKIKAISFK